MPTYGPYTPTTAVNRDDGIPGSAAWLNPTLILLSDGLFASRSYIDTPSFSLVVGGFNAQIPLTEYVTGIQFDIEGKRSGVGSSVTGELFVNIDSNGSPVNIGNSISINWTSAIALVKSYGNSLTTFGAQILAAMCNHPNFGFAMRASFGSGSSPTLALDSVPGLYITTSLTAPGASYFEPAMKSLYLPPGSKTRLS